MKSYIIKCSIRDAYYFFYMVKYQDVKKIEMCFINCYFYLC